MQPNVWKSSTVICRARFFYLAKHYSPRPRFLAPIRQSAKSAADSFQTSSAASIASSVVSSVRVIKPMRDNLPMPILQTIRQAPRLIRAVLAWFVLSVGLAVTAPLVQPQSLSLVCSAGGSVKLVASAALGEQGSPGAPVAAHHTLDCVLCLALAAPPSAAVHLAATAPLPAGLPLGQPGTHIIGRTAAPPPARGPPARA
jgi:hypothetical protein